MERNYHIFYMLLAGASKEQRQNYWLKPADQFLYLNQSGCLEINKRSDSKEFEELLQSVESLGIDSTISTQIFQLVAAILHLGNLTFGPSSTRDVDAGSRFGRDCMIQYTVLV
jgi:myosin heavy subunit